VRIKLHSALFASFLGVAALIVLLVVFSAGSGLRGEMRARFRTEIRHELALVGERVQAGGLQAPDSLADALGVLIGYRITFIDTDGVVVGDSQVDRAAVPDVENHSGRPEVLAAASDGLGFSERWSATVGVPFLYGAQYVETPAGRLLIRIAAPLDQVEAAVGRNRRVLWVAGLMGAGAGLIAALLLTALLSRPLVQLSQRASALAQGDFSELAPASFGIAEMQELSGAFNRLSDELQRRLEELGRERDEMQALIDTMAEGVVALTEDARVLRVNSAALDLLEVGPPAPYAPIDALVRHPELLEILTSSVTRKLDAREVSVSGRHLIASARPLANGGSVVTFLEVTEIRRLERVRRDFVANASHELKTPLTAIRGFAETLMESEPPPPLREQFLDAIQKNTVRLQRLVDDLLDLSRLESGAWDTGREAVAVVPLAEEVWAQTVVEVAEGPLAVERNASFSVKGDEWVSADPHALDQVFRNLFENSIRHLDDGGRVTVKMRRRDRDVVIEVIDDGAGIPADDLPRIFERFYRADAARSRDQGGTGLGLAIVRHFVEVMEGEVEAQSELGKGTTIRFTLPRAVDSS
jgi:two-component system, OmpR family, phosphate regulon sensor histidine kinase PhoR